MDPSAFTLDWDRLTQMLAAVVVLSFIVERALAPIVEHRVFLNKYAEKGVKEWLAMIVGIGVCVYWRFDAVSTVVTESITMPGMLLTGALIAGGSKGSVKLFHDVLGIRSSAHQKRYPDKAKKPEPMTPEDIEEAIKQLRKQMNALGRG